MEMSLLFTLVVVGKSLELLRSFREKNRFKFQHYYYAYDECDHYHPPYHHRHPCPFSTSDPDTLSKQSGFVGLL
jgi:hypothetical protein